MKVLVYSTLFPNNLQPNNAIFVKQRLFHLAKLPNCKIKVIAPVPYCPPWAMLGKRYQYAQIKKYEVIEGIEVFHPRYLLIPKISMPFHSLSLFLATRCLVKKIYQTFPFDLIDGHYIYPDGLASLFLAKSMNKPLILSARGSDINQFPNFKTIKPMISYALDRADHIISVSNGLKQEIINLGIDKEKITVIPNGVDTKKFYPINKNKVRDKILINNNNNNNKIILSVGSLKPNKGFHIILDALSRLLKKEIKIRLYIIGEGYYRSSLEQKIKDLNLGQYVTLVGEIANNELNFWYNLADVFCLASATEGWPNVIMESLACGTPVVATKAYGAKEILSSPNVGLLVNRTTESIYNGLKTALVTTWDRNQICSQVKNRDWFKVADEVKTVFTMVLNK